MTAAIEQHFREELLKREESQNLRKLTYPNLGIDFVSNDYLGLRKDPKLNLYIQEELQFLNPVEIMALHGTGASRLISGNYEYTEKLEKFLAQYYQSDAALLYNSGYQANLGVFGSILPRQGVFLYDALCHASIIDGIRLSYAKAYSFKHNDLLDLESKLQRAANAKSICAVVVESIYSMDGDRAPLAELVELCDKYSVTLIVDEAHASGVFCAAGLSNYLNLCPRIPIRIHTFGKALGCHGAVVVCSALLREYLINFSRPFMYTTAAPLSAVMGICAAHKLCQEAQQQRDTLEKNIKYFKELALSHKKLQKLITPQESTIQSIVVAGAENCRNLAEKLQQANFYVKPIFAPTVPFGQERIRICLHAYNTQQEIKELISVVSNGVI